MRVLHLPSSYFPDTLGGTEVYVDLLTAYLRARGHDSLIAWPTTSTDLPPRSFALPPIETATRRAVHTRDTGNEAAGFASLLERERPDLVHFHSLTLGAGLDHVRVIERLGVPYLITFHTPAMACSRGTWMRFGREPCDGVLSPVRCAACVLHNAGWPERFARIAARSPLPAARLPEGPWQTHFALPSLLQASFASWRAFFGGAKHVVACAEFAAEHLLANGVASERLSVLRQALPGPTRSRRLVVPRCSGALRLGFVGRFTAVKGPDLLLAAVRELRTRGIRCTAELVGPIVESDREWADQALRRSGDAATYLGELRGDALRRWVESIDVMVLPSRWFETGPLTLLEAWDAGTPVLGSDLGGIREFMLAQGLGDCLFPVESVAGIADALMRLLAQEGPSLPVEVPGMDELGSKMLGIYKRCLEGKGDCATGEPQRLLPNNGGAPRILREREP